MSQQQTPLWKQCKTCKVEKDVNDFRPKRAVCRKCVYNQSRVYVKANSEKHREYCRTYYRKHRNKILKQKQEYHQKVCGSTRVQKNTYRVTRRRTDSLYRLSDNLRSLIGKTFRRGGYTKRSRAESLLGVPFKVAVCHLIDTAINNYGYYDPASVYHIDHIIPVSSATTEQELIKLQHISNLQLLTPQDNLRKSSHIDWVLK